MLHKPPRPKFSSLSLYDGSIVGKMHLMTPNYLDRFKVKNTNMHTTYTPGPKFSSISLYDAPFLTYGPIFGKVHRVNPNNLDMFKVTNTNMHVTYTPEAQIFVRFALR